MRLNLSGMALSKVNIDKIELDGVSIPMPTTVCCLGVMLDGELSFAEHIKQLSNGCFYQLLVHSSSTHWKNLLKHSFPLLFWVESITATVQEHWINCPRVILMQGMAVENLQLSCMGPFNYHVSLFWSILTPLPSYHKVSHWPEPPTPPP